jgi:ABC-type multidrug transport system ATPase subunit
VGHPGSAAGSLVGLTAAAGSPLALGAALGVWALPIAALTGGWSSWCAPEAGARRGPGIFVIGVLLVAPLLSLTGITKFFGTKRVVRQVGLEVRAGERVVLLGSNGSGKSTLLAIAAGVLEPDDGRIVRTTAIGYAPEKPDIPEHLLVVEWLDVVGSLKKARFRPEDDLGIAPLLGTRVGALSLGQRQLLSLVAAWMGDPPLLLLDEPTNALDVASRDAVIERLRTRTVLVPTHDRELTLALATRACAVSDGGLAPHPFR